MAVDEFVTAANSRLQASQGKAVTTLVELLDDDNPTIRLRASATLLQTVGQRVNEMADDATAFARMLQGVLKEAPEDVRKYVVGELRKQQEGAS